MKAEYGDVRDDIDFEVTWQRADVLWSLLADRLTPEQAELIGKGLYEPMLQGLLQLRPTPHLPRKGTYRDRRYQDHYRDNDRDPEA